MKFGTFGPSKLLVLVTSTPTTPTTPSVKQLSLCLALDLASFEFMSLSWSDSGRICNTLCSIKKDATKLWAVTLSNVNRF